jgi:hypothetical protein
MFVTFFAGLFGRQLGHRFLPGIPTQFSDNRGGHARAELLRVLFDAGLLPAEHAVGRLGAAQIKCGLCGN